MARRILAPAATVISTLLLGAVAVDWAYSLRNSETLVLVRRPRVYAIDNYQGQISFWAGDLMPAAQKRLSDGWRHVHWDAPRAKRAQDFNIMNPAGQDLWLAGCGLTTQRRFPTTFKSITYSEITGNTGVIVPLWLLTVAFVVLPALALINWRRARRRQTQGLCPFCGYDLRASPERCPECGHAIPSPLTGAPPEAA